MLSLDVAETGLLTTQCSAGCSHCPIARPGLEGLFLTRDILRKMFAKSKAPLRVISGSEPFEHPKITGILEDLRNERKPFRIATGGFMDLAPWLKGLADLSRNGSGFEGISLGTDVLTSRCGNEDLQRIWKGNVLQLNAAGIPYSLTVTLGGDLSPELVCLLRDLQCRPEFIYLRCHSMSDSIEWLEPIAEAFKEVPVIEDYIS